MTSTHTAFRDVLTKFKSRLSQEEEQDFQFSTLDDVRVSMHEIQEEQGRRRTMMNMTRVQSFLEAMEQYGRVVEVFLNASEVLCFIWGPMKFCLQVASAWAESFDILLDAYKQLAENLPLLQQFQELFLDNPQMIDVLSLMYKDILEFHLAALRVFKKPTWKQLFRSTWKDFKTRFQHILDDLQSHKRLVECQANLLAIEEAKVGREKANIAFKETREAERKQRYLTVRTWLSSMEAILDQEGAEEMRRPYPNSGKWIFENDVIKGWMDPLDTVSNMVWMNGIPGAGKTILTSRIIEERRRIDSTSTIFFYCKYQDAQRRSFLAVSRSMLSQLLHFHDDLLPYLYDECIASGQASLVSVQTATEVLKTCLNTIGQTYIIIDGIDECDNNERKAILSFFISQIENDITPGRLRGLFISQDENDMRKLLRTASILRLAQEHNRSDIEAYTHYWIGAIGRRFDLHDATSNYIRDAVLNRCEGMFLFAKLVLTNLHDQVSNDKFQQELAPGTFPKGFEQAYERIVHRIFSNPNVSERETAQKLLGWIVSAKRPLKWHEIQGAVSINTSERIVDFDNRHLRTHVRDFCGSLVDVLPGDHVQLVHETAKSYLIDKSHVQLLIEEYRLALLCMKYLTFDCFDPDISNTQVTSYLATGQFAFQDYAVVHWVDHLDAIIPSLRNDDFELIGPAVNEFHDTYGDGDLLADEIPTELRDRCSALGRFDYAECLMSLMTNTRKTRDANEDLSGLGDLGMFIDRNRKLLENMKHSSQSLESSMNQLEQYHGRNWAKCPRHKCYYFHEGFSDATQRNKHVLRHEKPFCCTELSCPRIHLGFSTEKELKKHMIFQHPDPAAFAWKFPKIIQTQKHRCPECPKEFTRAHSLRIHLRTHANERKYGCKFCTKTFVRKYDRDRHEEKLHPEQERGEQITSQ